MPDDMPHLTEGTLRAQFDERTWQRGRSYARTDRVRYPSRHGATLRALVRGSAPQPYGVEVTLHAQGIAKARCTCPVGGHGECKHVAAVLLVWLDAPGRVAEREPPALALPRMGKDDLVALALRMLARHPDLEALLTTPGATDGDVSASGYRDRAAAALGLDGSDDDDERYDDRYDDRYDGPGGFGGDFDALACIADEGDAFARDGEYRAAAAVYVGVASAVLDGYEEMPGFEYDEGDEVLDAVGRCLDGLRDCLPHETDAEHRAEIVETLYRIATFEYEIPGGEGVWALLAAQATPDEKHMVARWVGDGIGPNPHPRSRREAGERILALEGDTYDTGAYLRFCEEMGLTVERIARLLELDRTSEATRALRDVEDTDALAVAQLLTDAGEAETAARFVRARAQRSGNPPLWEWLRDQLRARGDAGGALVIAERVFRAAPTLPRYEIARALAHERGVWDTARPVLLDAVRSPAHRDMHIAILLDEGDHAVAVALTLDAMAPADFALAHAPFHRAVPVAEAVAETHPDGAREIFAREAERHIERRNREAYAEASRLLVRVRDLFDRTDRYDDWLAYRDDLQRRYRTLRALREEMHRAGLLD